MGLEVAAKQRKDLCLLPLMVTIAMTIEDSKAYATNTITSWSKIFAICFHSHPD